MPLYETYASRVAATEKAGVPDVYTYDHLPEFLRDQIAQIFTDCIGPGWKGVIGNYFLSPDPPNANHSWRLITKTMNKEVQSFRYFFDKRGYAYDKCMNYIRRDSDLNGVLSLIQICGRVMFVRLFLGGTDGSNPVPSSGESGANPSLAGIRLPSSRSRGFPRVCAARLAARSAETRRVEQYRTKERQYLCRPLFQYRRAAGRFGDRGGAG